MNQRGFFIPSPMMFLGGAAIVMGITTILFYNLYRGAVNDYANFKASVEQAQEQIRIENERKIAELTELNRQSKAGWDDALAALSKRPPIRVQPVRCPSSMPTVSFAPTGTDGPAKEPQPDPARYITIEQCEAIANNAIEDALKVVSLQDWIRKAREATK